MQFVKQNFSGRFHLGAGELPQIEANHPDCSHWGKSTSQDRFSRVLTARGGSLPSRFSGLFPSRIGGHLGLWYNGT